MIEWQHGVNKPYIPGVYLRHRTTCSQDPVVEFSFYDGRLWHIECCYPGHAAKEMRISNYQEKPWAFPKVLDGVVQVCQ